MSFYRKAADLFRKVKDAVVPKAPDLNVPVRYTDLPDPQLPRLTMRRVAEKWPFTNAYRAYRKRRNKIAAKSRHDNWRNA